MRPIGASVHVCGSRRARHRHNDFGPVGASGYVSGPDEWRACVCLGARLARQSMSRGPNGAAFTGLCMSRGPNGAAVYVSGPYWRVCQCPGARMAHLSMSRGPIGASRGTELKGLAGVRTRPRRGAGAAGRGHPYSNHGGPSARHLLGRSWPVRRPVRWGRPRDPGRGCFVRCPPAATICDERWRAAAGSPAGRQGGC